MNSLADNAVAMAETPSIAHPIGPEAASNKIRVV